MVGRVVDFSLLPQHQPLRSGPADARSRLHEFVIIAWRLGGQATFTVLKDAAIVRKPQPFSSSDAFQSRSKIDVPAINDAAVFVLNAHIADEQRIFAVATLLHRGLSRRTRRTGRGGGFALAAAIFLRPIFDCGSGPIVGLLAFGRLRIARWQSVLQRSIAARTEMVERGE